MTAVATITALQLVHQSAEACLLLGSVERIKCMEGFLAYIQLRFPILLASQVWSLGTTA